MVSANNYYKKIKDEQHVFVYCVGGRSSSTAFQRILNSSNTVWIWGEPHGIIDNIVSLIDHMTACLDNAAIQYSLIQMHDCYKNNKHINFYPNAIGNLPSTIETVNSTISNLLKPGAYGLKRFGFKDIQVKSINTLFYLRKTFPQCFILFCFRDPLQQWPSVNKRGWWSYSADLENFLSEYYNVSKVYLDFASNTNTPVFVENNDLRDPNKVKKIISYLNLTDIDWSLVDFTVHSTESNVLSDSHKSVILSSEAYRNYLKMKELAFYFFNSETGK